MGAQAAAALAAPGWVGFPPAGWDAPRTGSLRLVPPPWYDLDRVARSHGGAGLAPSAYVRPTRTLHRTVGVPGAGAVTVSVRTPGPGAHDGAAVLQVSWGGGALGGEDRTALERVVARVLALDDDLTELHAVAPRWVREAAAGRLLRAPTVWEDLVATLLSTNTSYSAVQRVMAGLVGALGSCGLAGAHGFPAPAAVLAAGEPGLRGLGCGYRAGPLLALAVGCDGREEHWLAGPSAPPDDEVRAELQRLRGFGPLCVDTMMGLLGRPRGCTVDGWLRRRLDLPPGPLPARYARYGRWAGTVAWLDATRDLFPGCP